MKNTNKLTFRMGGGIHNLSASHTGTTHGPRTEKVAIVASALSFAGCASPCIRYSCVERAGPTLCIRRRSLCASGFLCMPKTVRLARRLNVHARRTPAMRRARWTNARHTRGMCCVFVDGGLAHTQRASNACPARPAFF